MPERLVVLVVEDEVLLRMNAVELIEDLGFDVAEAGHADEAIEILEGRPDVHLVFTDIHMPGSMDGLRLTHYIRDRWPPIKLIATSGKARLSDNDLPSGSVFLPKPYSTADIGTVFGRMIGDQ